MMKNLFLIFSLLSISAVSQTTDTLHLRGQVKQSLSIEVEEEAIAGNLDLFQSQHRLKVATIVEYSNAENGYKVNVNSNNNGYLTHSDGSVKLPYFLIYGGYPIDLRSGTTIPDTSRTPGEQRKEVDISYDGAAPGSLIAGEYTDQVIFTIEAI